MNLAEFKIRQLQRRVMAQSKATVLKVKKITSDTYAGSTTYTGESFILLDIYPKTNGTVKVTYGGLTKTITDTSGEKEPNAQQVFFGTFNGVSDSVETPESGTLTIEGDYAEFGISTYSKSKSSALNKCSCIYGVEDFGKITAIPYNAFYGCTGLTSIIIPEGVTDIGSNAFYGCTGLTSVTIPSAIRLGGLGTNIFYGCTGLTSIIIPEGITHIMEGMFYGCTGLTSVTIPSSVDRIYPNAFYLESSYSRTVTMLSTKPASIYNTTFDVVGSNKIIVPIGCSDAYKTANNWSNYADYITEASE